MNIWNITVPASVQLIARRTFYLWAIVCVAPANDRLMMGRGA